VIQKKKTLQEIKKPFTPPSPPVKGEGVERGQSEYAGHPPERLKPNGVGPDDRLKEKTRLILLM